MAVVAESRSSVPIWQNRTIRSLFYQALVLALIALATWFFVSNTATNLAHRGIASGFDFLRNTAGFDISFYLVDYTLRSTYGRALVIGILNTLLVSAIGIVLATIIGFVVGVARLSRNWLVAKLAAVYVDLLRNIPLLVQLIFWYFGVLSTLPGVRQSIGIFDLMFLNQRGLFVPAPILQPGYWVMPVAFLVGIVAAVVITIW